MCESFPVSPIKQILFAVAMVASCKAAEPRENGAPSVIRYGPALISSGPASSLAEQLLGCQFGNMSINGAS